MRTVVVDGPRSIRVDTRPDPALSGPDGVIVEVTASGICGSDLHFYEADFPMPDPIALGHEAVGTVVESGPDVRSVKVGDQVMVSSVTGCGSCPGCATHDPVMLSLIHISLVRELASDGFPVTVTCRVLKFSPQGYYQWLKSPCSKRDYDNAHLTNALIDLHRDDPTFGYRFMACLLYTSRCV